jgi:hypothetical protein
MISRLFEKDTIPYDIADGIYLTNLVAFEFPLDVIRKINDKRLMSHGYSFDDNLMADYMFYAAFHRDPNVLSFFVDRHKDEVNYTLKNLHMMKERGTELRLTVGNKERILTQEDCEEAIHKLLKVAKYLPFNQKIVLDYLLNTIADAKTPDEWEKIYIDHIDEPYVNPKNNRHAFSIFKKSYSPIKKMFIEHIQRNIVEYFMDVEAYKGKNINAYYAVCQHMLQNDIFSEIHEKHGVNPIFRRNLNRRFKEIADLSLCNRLHRV